MSEAPSLEHMEAEDWAGEMGDTWLANLDRFESMLAPVGAALMEHAAFRNGERVIDVGCGGGGTTIAIAQAVAPEGEVLGIDISPALVGEAEKRARAAGPSNISFMVADATFARPAQAPVDRLFSRFGSMFFPEPEKAFSNLRHLLRNGGRMDLGVWAPPSENAWVVGLLEIIGRYVELPEPEPFAPGPFALGDPDRVHSLLSQAGFERIECTLWRGDQLVGGAGADPESAAEFVLDAFPFAEPLADKPEVKAQVRDDLVGMFEKHRASDGVRIPAAAWFVTACASA
jgi:SAM-dependent methyltransferase